MDQQKLDLILDSLILPQGLFSIYDCGDIGSYAGSKISKLDSVEQYKFLGKQFALDMKYLIGRENINFQLLATSYTSFPYTYDWTTQKARIWQSPTVIAELGNFSYGHEQTIELGNKMLQGENVGFLEDEILKECMKKDPEYAQVRQQIGSHFIALGEFAQRLSQRSLDPNVNMGVPYYVKLKRTG